MKKRVWAWIGGGFLGLILLFVVIFWDAIRVAMSGKIDLSETEQTAYQGSVDENLKAIHTALLFYHENEGQFPAGNGWMDAVLPQLRTNDLKDGEERKKLQNPGLKNLGANESGFALNEAFAGKFKDDGGKPGDLLIYVSPEDRAWNAIGKPKKGARGITLEGKLAEAP